MADRLKKPLPSVADAKIRARTGRQPMEVSTLNLPGKPEPHRYRVSVPVADEAVAAWMELQDDRSLSVRMLIRESIARLGYVDVVNRPVDQLPKRGRPAGQGEDEADGTAEPGTTGEVRAMRREYERKTGVEAEGFRTAMDRGRPAGRESGTYQVTTAEEHIAAVQRHGDHIKSLADGDAAASDSDSGDLDLSPAEDAEPELRGIALTTPTLKQEPDRQESEAVTVPPTPEPEQSSGGQMDVHDIFKTLR